MNPLYYHILRLRSIVIWNYYTYVHIIYYMTILEDDGHCKYYILSYTICDCNIIIVMQWNSKFRTDWCCRFDNNINTVRWTVFIICKGDIFFLWFYRVILSSISSVISHCGGLLSSHYYITSIPKGLTSWNTSVPDPTRSNVAHFPQTTNKSQPPIGIIIFSPIVRILRL